MRGKATRNASFLRKATAPHSHFPFHAIIVKLPHLLPTELGFVSTLNTMLTAPRPHAISILPDDLDHWVCGVIRNLILNTARF